eukprot:gnl/TRDRNA2_/TRDRNA2_150180_c1_seq2.p1 gnl/TRDRNA2_/TRDRNA2_150180_c1~~gnl/TRDRNA2_/TRDRNA2_150180_c1_seq2.p1  ORF type:complete len:335 (+),score=83.86 gnl/TRDRNA2_/TRDRNA2_150180_c1_seq2:101-1006(+)
MFDEAEHDEAGECTSQELMKMLPRIQDLLESRYADFPRHNLERLINAMDTDGSGTIDKAEFSQGIMFLAEEVGPSLILDLHYLTLKCFQDKLEHIEETMTRKVQEHTEPVQEKVALLEGYVNVLGSKVDSLMKSSGEIAATRGAFSASLLELSRQVQQVAKGQQELHRHQELHQLYETSQQQRSAKAVPLQSTPSSGEDERGAPSKRAEADRGGGTGADSATSAVPASSPLEMVIATAAAARPMGDTLVEVRDLLKELLVQGRSQAGATRELADKVQRLTDGQERLEASVAQLTAPQAPPG